MWWRAATPLLLSRAKAFLDTEVGLAAGGRSLWMPGEQWGPWKLMRAGSWRHHRRVSEVGGGWSHAGAWAPPRPAWRVPTEERWAKCSPPHPLRRQQDLADPEDTGAGSRLAIHLGHSPSLATKWFRGSLHPCGCWELTAWLCFGAVSEDYELLLNGFIRENMQMFFGKSEWNFNSVWEPILMGKKFWCDDRAIWWSGRVSCYWPDQHFYWRLTFDIVPVLDILVSAHLCRNRSMGSEVLQL